MRQMKPWCSARLPSDSESMGNSSAQTAEAFSLTPHWVYFSACTRFQTAWGKTYGASRLSRQATGLQGMSVQIFLKLLLSERVYRVDLRCKLCLLMKNKSICQRLTLWGVNWRILVVSLFLGVISVVSKFC